ncbi:hypothetical protein TrLO_g4010 [Triparma laevis f. longispina]|uniref:Dual specificity protein phosphatase n=1 Tax=Triparma laevis f. longispina TaxID=1714387 RepID=A0A9W7A8W7_9STRA|nr:hypothetical protein TrLO_g4010 [Triparma laevis f. longispina]
MSSPQMSTLSSPPTGRASPAILHGLKSAPSYKRSVATGKGRRAVRELMTPGQTHLSGPVNSPSKQSSLSKTNGSSSESKPDSSDKTKKINFVKMLLAIKMVKTDGTASEVFPNIFIGSIGSAYNLSTLSNNSITHILCLCDGVREKFKSELTYMVVPCQDVPNYDIALKFIQCADFIDNAVSEGGRVLVHCFAGKSRVCAILMGYLMLRKGMAFEQALETCRRARPVVEPNLGFVAQLRALDRSLRRSRLTWFRKVEGGGAGAEAEGQGLPQPPGGNNNMNGATPPEPPEQMPPGAAYATPMADGQSQTTTNAFPPKALETDLHHVNKAAQSTPKVSPGQKGSHSKTFSRSATLTIDFSEANNSIVVKGKKNADEDDMIKRYNKKVATRACDRLYTKAVDQRIRATGNEGVLSPEYTFNPELNEVTLQHAMVARSRHEGKRGYMEETAAARSLMREQGIKAEAMATRAMKGGLRRFSGYGSIFYDSEMGSPRDLGRTSPTVEEFDFIPNVKESRYTDASGKALVEQSLETRLNKGTVSSTIDRTIAWKKKEMIDKYGGKGRRDRLSASGLLEGVDEVEALVISEARRERIKKNEVQENVFMKKIGGEEEVEKNALRLQKLYKEGLKSYNERVEKMENAPLSVECTFSPTFFSKTKSLKPKDTSTGRSRDMNYDVSTGRVSSLSPGKARGGVGSPVRAGGGGGGGGPNVINMATIRSARKQKKEEEEKEKENEKEREKEEEEEKEKEKEKEREKEEEEEEPEPSPLLQALSLGGNNEETRNGLGEGEREGGNNNDMDLVSQHTRSHDDKGAESFEMF